MEKKQYLKIDYADGAHERVLEEIIKLNSGSYDGYGHDEYTKSVIEMMRIEIGKPDASINFLPGGTHTNLIAIRSFLRPYEAVISADIGHINVNECGAIEATGHKVIAVPTTDGKLTPFSITKVVKSHNSEHMLIPRLVYISNTLENGNFYSKEELEAISKCCKEHKLFLYLDGARLAQALANPKCKLTLKDIANLTDAFYIGGTKNGMLYGEALIIMNDVPREHVRHAMKQSGGVLAKTWVMAAQFKVMFEDGLYYELGKNGNDRAKDIYDGLKELEIEFLDQWYSNQIFPIFDNKVLEKLSNKYEFQKWEVIDESKTAVRIATSFKTSKEVVDMLICDTRKLIRGENNEI